ncbi:hypothetical protein PG988_001430 [Apiospora saccharicola]
MEAIRIMISNPRPALVVLVAVPCLTTIIWWTISYLAFPLRKYPGPFRADWTNWWRFFLVRSGSYHLAIKKLHDNRGPVVRIGPNTLDIDYPELSKTFYGTDGKWKKTEFYQNNSAIVNGEITYHIFSEINQENHARMKRPIAQYYTASSVSALEPLTDKVLREFCGHLETRFMGDKEGKPFDFGEWISFCSWDISGAAPFSRQFGYMDQGRDYDHTISIADVSLDYLTEIGPQFRRRWSDSPPRLPPGQEPGDARRPAPPEQPDPHRPGAPHRPPARPRPGLRPQRARFPAALHRNQAEESRAGRRRRHRRLPADQPPGGRRHDRHHPARHLLPRLARAPGLPPAAGRRNPRGRPRDRRADVPAFVACRKLPYLEAVIREATRVHPGVCMLLGRFVPAGVAVGINPYVAGRNQGVWGDDPDTYRPERWLRGHAPGAPDETEDEYKQQLRRFNVADLAFGGGSHICIGRNLALLETYKVVATIVKGYHVELEDPAREWKVTDSWFTRQEGLRCRMRLRSGQTPKSAS